VASFDGTLERHFGGAVCAPARPLALHQSLRGCVLDAAQRAMAGEELPLVVAVDCLAESAHALREALGAHATLQGTGAGWGASSAPVFRRFCTLLFSWSTHT
jgi:hypothetical protein